MLLGGLKLTLQFRKVCRLLDFILCVSVCVCVLSKYVLENVPFQELGVRSSRHQETVELCPGYAQQLHNSEFRPGWEKRLSESAEKGLKGCLDIQQDSVVTCFISKPQSFHSHWLLITPIFCHQCNMLQCCKLFREKARLRDYPGPGASLSQGHHSTKNLPPHSQSTLESLSTWGEPMTIRSKDV